MHSKKWIYLIFIITILNQTMAFGQKAAARFLLWHPSAVSAAMGGTGTAYITNAFATYFNPAGLSFSNHLELSGTLFKPFKGLNVYYMYFSGARKFKEKFTLAFTYFSKIKGRQNIISNSGELLGKTKRNSDDLYKISFAYKLNSRIGIGIGIGRLIINSFSLNLLEEGKNAYVVGNSILFDAGIMLKNLFPNLSLNLGNEVSCSNCGLSIGIAILNFGSKIKFRENEIRTPLPTKFLLGVSYLPFYSKNISSLLSIDLENHIGENNILKYIRMGGEINLYNALFIRAGTTIHRDSPELSYFSYGLGLNFWIFQINISRYKRTYKTIWHGDLIISF